MLRVGVTGKVTHGNVCRRVICEREAVGRRGWAEKTTRVIVGSY